MNVLFRIVVVDNIYQLCLCVKFDLFRYSRWGQKLLLLLISPLSILYASAVISSLDKEYQNILELLYISWNALSHGLLLSMVDRYFFGSWLFTLFSFAVLPNWLTFWGISFCEAV